MPEPFTAPTHTIE